MAQPEPISRNPEKGYVALLGWSLNAVEALDRFDRRYVVAAPDWAEEYCRDNEIPYVPWNFERLNDRSMEIAESLQEMGVDVAIPLYEETVEWAGAINSVLLDNPRLLAQAMLLRDKALMKRRAQLGGIRVGIFEEAHDKGDVIRFLKRVNQTLLKLDGDPNDRSKVPDQLRQPVRNARSRSPSRYSDSARTAATATTTRRPGACFSTRTSLNPASRHCAMKDSA